VRNKLLERFGGSVRVVGNPDKTAPDKHLPDFIVYAEGVEFHDLPDETTGMSHTPRTTHLPKGFVITPGGGASPPHKMPLTEVAQLFR
jgi:hypothetical protein